MFARHVRTRSAFRNSFAGERGTGKTCTVRALAALLPELEVVEGDPCNSSPTDLELQSPEASTCVSL